MAQGSFSGGNTVRLKSGGPLMTVEKVDKDAGNKPLVWCVYFDDKNKEQRKAFPLESLEADGGAPFPLIIA